MKSGGYDRNLPQWGHNLQAKITKVQQNDIIKKQCRINIAAVISDRIWSKQGL